MGCHRPLTAYRSREGQVTIGKQCRDDEQEAAFALPCGRCFGCLAERRQQWALRAEHEASLWQHNQFLTLTVDDDHITWHRGLEKRQLQLFFKRLRKLVGNPQRRRTLALQRPLSTKLDHTRIRYLACGEYGEKTKRAHYHALIFNLHLPDLKPYGKETYTSDTVSTLWPLGTHLLGTVTPASCAYVAGYVTKKIHDRAELERAYTRTNLETGEEILTEREFMLCSRRPGIGTGWYHKYKDDLRYGYLVHNGSKLPIPRFYEAKYQRDYPEQQEARDLNRKERAIQKAQAQTEISATKRAHDNELTDKARHALHRKPTALEG